MSVLSTACIRLAGILLAVVLTASTAADCHAADELEKQLLDGASKLVAGLKSKGYKNVGVLKFRIKKGKEQVTDRVGPLNMRLAEKLELALIIGSPVENPLGVIRNASKVAATIPGASHLTAEGRQKLFQKKYPLAWGRTSVAPDAFISGALAIEDDLSKAYLSLVVFDQRNPQLQKLAQLEFRPDLEDLLETGESFSVRGLSDLADEEVDEDERKNKATTAAVQTALLTKRETAARTQPVASQEHPLSSNSPAPVSLEIRYDNRPVRIEFRNGAAFVPEPRENQEISLVVRRKGSDRPRLGVVLKVNGENTLYREKLADPECTPWVFDSNLAEFGITGYQTTNKTMEKFKVLSQAESKAREIDYGEYVGTISISVFPEELFEPKVPHIALTDDGEDFATLERANFPDKTPENFDALKKQLAYSTTRGLITNGASVDSKIGTVTFKNDKIPIMSATVRYYHPQR